MAERIPAEEVERLLAEATPGPWLPGETNDAGEFYFAAGFVTVDHGEPDSWGDREPLVVGSLSDQPRRDARLLAAAPDLAADLLDARRENERVREALSIIHDALTSALNNGGGVPPSVTLGIESIARHALREAVEPASSEAPRG